MNIRINITMVLVLTLVIGMLIGTGTEIAVAADSDFIIDVNHVLTGYKGIGGNITIPSGVTGIGENAFAGCTSITSVKIPKSVTVIKAYAFDSCTNITSVVLPSQLAVIEEGAFWGCSSLKEFTIPENVHKIGKKAFCGCSQLTGMQVSKNVTEIGYYALGYEFINGTYIPSNDFTIIGEKESSAYDYAQEYELSFATKKDLSVTIKNASSTSGKKATVSWKKNPFVSGYQIEYSTGSSFSKATTKTITVKNNMVSKKTIRKLSSGRKYYIRIRGYKTINGMKVTSAWSKPITLTIR